MRRAKKPLLGMAAAAVFIFCALLLSVGASAQGVGAGSPARNRNQNRGVKRASARGETQGRSRNTAGEAEPNASPTASPGAARPSGVKADAETQVGPPVTPADNQPPTDVKRDGAGAGNTNPPGGATNQAAAGQAAWWHVYGIAGSAALGLLSLVTCAFTLRRLKRIERAIGGIGPSQSLPTLTGGVWPQPVVYLPDPDAARVPSPTDAGQNQPLPSETSGLADAVKKLTSRLDEIEKQLADDDTPSAEAATEADVMTPAGAAEASPSVGPPQMVTVDKMVEWANGAGLKLETVKATFGLFGNFGQSDDGDNWLALADGTSYLFPRVSRFESASHFKSDYLDYYDCDQPSAGTVLIDRPATVSSDPQGGWKLVNKGKLSVAAS